MRCAWESLMKILPPAIAAETDKRGSDTLQELRLRLGKPPELVPGGTFGSPVTRQDLSFVVNTASRYSPWAAATAARGYITATGGHRIGLCGEVALKDGSITGIREPTSLCIRVARDFPGLAKPLGALEGNVLILGPPGSGKTTLLRDLIRQLSRTQCVCVVDERGELFPAGFDTGDRTDVLSGSGKAEGITAVLRTMGPEVIAVDEITSAEDCQALTQAGWCGVRLLATAHAASAEDLYRRPVYRPLAEGGLFETLVILHADKSWRTERMMG